MQRILYPTIEEIVETNRRALEEVRVHKADRHGILMGSVGVEKIQVAIQETRADKGDIYSKAATLLISLAKDHPFESGNRRTAYLSAVEFLKANGSSAVPRYDVEVMRGVRHGTHKTKLTAWLRGHGQEP